MFYIPKWNYLWTLTPQVGVARLGYVTQYMDESLQCRLDILFRSWEKVILRNDGWKLTCSWKSMSHNWKIPSWEVGSFSTSLMCHMPQEQVWEAHSHSLGQLLFIYGWRRNSCIHNGACAAHRSRRDGQRILQYAFPRERQWPTLKWEAPIWSLGLEDGEGGGNHDIIECQLQAGYIMHVTCRFIFTTTLRGKY